MIRYCEEKEVLRREILRKGIMVEYIFKIFKDVKIEKGSGWMNKVDVRKKK